MSAVAPPAARRIQLTPEEKKVFGQLFKQCDPEGLGVVTGEVARPLFERSGLAANILGEIWQVADSENSGFLDQTGFSLALRLIGRVQNGQRLTPNLGSVAGPLPVFDGRARLDPVSTGSEPAGSRVPQLTPSDRQRFIGLFEKNATGGILPGDRARDILLKARLSNETLGEIWNLADTQSRGSLTQSEFVIAMHLIQSVINGSIKQIPSQLPPALIEAAASGTAPSRNSFRQGSIGSNASLSRQFSGRESPILRPNSTGQAEWTISSQEKARFDHIFGTIDKSKRGSVGASEVVPFLTTSKLPEDVLAQVWDLSDLNNTGVFGKSEFAIAMYLVQQKLAGRDLPTVIPPTLLASATSTIQPGIAKSDSIPPTSDAPNPVFFPGAVSASENASSSVRVPQPRAVSVVAPAPAASGSLKDLVDLNDVFSSPSPSISAVSPTNVNAKVEGSSLPHQFVPTSSFGQSIAKETPAAPASRSISQSTTIVRPNATGDLLADAGSSDVQRQLSSATTDMANLSNQMGSVQSQHRQQAEKRQVAETELARVLAAKKDIEGKLALLRTSYDSEVQRVHQAQEMLRTSKEETAKLSQDYSVLAASLEALQQQYQQVSNSLAQDQHENNVLKENIRAVNEQTAQLTQTVEATEKDNKQQRNLVAVARSQLQAAQEEQAAAEAALKQAQEEQASLKHAQEDLASLSSQTSTAATINARDIGSSTTPTPGASALAPAALGALAGVAGSAAVSEALSYGSATSEDSHRSSSAGSGNPFARRPSQQSSGTNHSGNRLFDESFRQMDIISPSTTAEPTQSSIQAAEETPQSSPPTSDFAFHGNENGTTTIPSFTLPLGRPQSATSSVQNNAPLSVRGDFDTSRPDSPVYTSEPVSGMVPPESLELPSQSEQSTSHQYDEHVLTADEFQAQGGSARPVSREIIDTPEVDKHSFSEPTDSTIVEPPTSTATVNELPETSVPFSASNELHETSDSFEFVNAEDSDKSSRDIGSSAESFKEQSSAPPSYSKEVTANESSVLSAPLTTVPVAAGPAEVFPEIPTETTETDAFERSHGVRAASTSTETEDEDLYVDAPSHMPGAFPGSFAASLPNSEFAEKEASADASSTIPVTSHAPAESVPPTSFSAVSDIPFEASRAEKVDEDSSDDEEGPEEVIPTRRPFGSVSEVAGGPNEGLPFSFASENLPVEDESEFIFTSAPATIVAPAVSTTLATTTVPSRSPFGINGQDSATYAPPVLPLKQPNESNEQDLFADAFDDLDEAQEVKEGDVTADYSQSYASDFDTSLSNAGFGAPQFESTGDASRFAPASHVAATSVTGAVPSSNDEWEQLFDGFGDAADNGASRKDINDAFAVNQSSATTVGARTDSPKSQALNELTGIGFNREDALAALKKHSYNIVEASNYLLDKS